MNMLKITVLLLALSIGHAQVRRGAQVRLTDSGLKYAASLVVKKLHNDLRSKRIETIRDSSGDTTWEAENIVLRQFNINNFRVSLLEGKGVKLVVEGISVEATGKVSARYKKGWIKVSDSTSLTVSGRGLGMTLEVKLYLGGCINNQNCRPIVSTSACSASVQDINLKFRGGLSWIYNALSSILESKLEGTLKKMICREGSKILNEKGNDLFRNIPTRQVIENKAWLDYSFQGIDIKKNYFDLMLRGEFLPLNNPTPGPVSPPVFDTTAESNKMAYIWLSDYLVNSAGKILHDSGELKEIITANDKVIPDQVKPFLNTKSFESFIPQLYKKYPDRPIQFSVASNAPPKVEIHAGSIVLKLFARIAVEVSKADGGVEQVFYVILDITASGSVKTRTANNQLYIAGSISDFKFDALVGGSIIGHVNVPIDNLSVKNLVKGLVIDRANPILAKGFPIPEIRDLELRNTRVSLVDRAIRLDTDIIYNGGL